MSQQLRCSSALAGSFVTFTALSAPVFAQGVTAPELWGAWQDGVAVAGGTLSATELREGNQLILQDLRLDMGDEAGVLQLERLTLVNQADGTVAVILPDRFPLMFELPDPAEGEEVAADRPEKVFVTVDAPNLNLTVRGLGERAEFQAAAPEMTLTLDRFVPPIPAENGTVKMSAVLGGFDLRYLQDLAIDAPMIDGALSFATLDAVMSAEGGASGSARMDLKIGASSAAVSGAVPVSAPAMQAAQSEGAAGNLQISTLLALFDAGMRGNVSVTLGATGMTGSVSETGADQKPDDTSWDIGFGGFSASIGADATKAGYATVLKQLQFMIRGDIPDFPANEMQFSLGEYRVSLEAGLNGLTRPQDWTAAYVLRDFDMSDALWDIAAKGGKLPRDPITLALDLSGQFGIRPEALQPGWKPSGPELPFSNFSFKINEMGFSGLGVHVAGQGGMGLDFTDLTSFDGLPLPSGRVSILTTGAYALIDLLAASGQMSEEEVSGFRAGLLMIGRAGEAPDTLHTELDFRDKGFYLNGMKIR